MEIDFPLGLPGFDLERRFLLYDRPGFEPIVFLQSLASPELTFAALPVKAIDPDYSLELTPDDVAILEPAAGDLLALAILTANDPGPLTANLLAPVVVNLARRTALQSVRSDSRYSHCHPLGEKAPCS